MSQLKKMKTQQYHDKKKQRNFSNNNICKKINIFEATHEKFMKTAPLMNSFRIGSGFKNSTRDEKMLKWFKNIYMKHQRYVNM